MTDLLHNYKIPVPTIIPEYALKDELGRSWTKQSDSYFSWDGDFYYVWFRRNKKPEIGERIKTESFSKTIKKLYIYRNYKRGVVEFETDN
ncbi:MAG: hypothetical protein CMF41_07005 [Legionellales bacterium]|nr:hypothetical protein [Legionellales bacterium]OUX63544.1 MAG: hypothetical protein CBE41_04625 [Gammaproteobacteria bacterium TMED281]|tara:strand:+ start:435 stop:704 length:270 start_codon:yes stop_codon:yes gene_type:complete